ncbi:MAG: XRE family transcriptional regulator [Candidatus Eisenbacteria bacterium]|uniref:XRE family transcriptional regulator n=1 Tax=Eiseniibacteriota bacterium TaxID=2212470 RepID=A0A538U202_UNCEI|nr:MAG: XRE family transcriptional regulator [Candidatus Eisenbacteria bacterium]
MRSGASRANRRGAKTEIPVERSSGNVFEDIGLGQSDELLVKSEIAARIAVIIEKRGLTQARAAEILRIDQPSVSDLVRGRLRGFSSDRLFRFLNALGQDVRIVIVPRPPHSRRIGHLRVVDDHPQAASAGTRARR